MQKNLAKGLGCLISKEYHKYNVQKQKHEDEVENQNQGPKALDGNEDHEGGFSVEIDDFLKALGYDDSLIVQVIMILTRRERGTLQRILPRLVRFLNDKYGWKLDPNMMKSLFTMINGTKKESQQSGFWGINEDVISCFSSLMLCPVLEIDEEKEKQQAEEAKQTIHLAQAGPADDTPHFANSPSPKESFDRRRASATKDSEIAVEDMEGLATARSTVPVAKQET